MFNNLSSAVCPGNYFDVNFNSATPKEITSSFSLIMAFLHDIKELVRPYYLVNCILSISFLVLKTVSPMCMYLFPVGESQCELDMVNTFFLITTNFTLIIDTFLYRNNLKSCFSFSL